MICKNCGAKLKGTPHKCPLCDFKFEERGAEPKTRKKGVRVYKNPFTPIYIFTILVVVVALLIATFCSKLNHSVWITVLVSGMMLYFFLRHTILGVRNYTSKTTYLSSAVCLFIVILIEILGLKRGYPLIYPIVQASFFLLSLILLACQFKVFKPYLAGFLTQTLFSYVPLAITLISCERYVLPLVIAICESVFSLVLLILFPKEIWNQIKRFFAA